ncbi:hypothetical protein JW977_00220 [Candidatus Falkowbacteria bacterium]|nr:hypothetical protein [Candidatus Falkowbacteria bacterium]
MKQEKQISIFVITDTIAGMLLNIGFVGEDAVKNKLGPTRVNMTYSCDVSKIPEGRNFDLIISMLDVPLRDMKKRKGFEVIEEAKKLYPNAQVILYSAFNPQRHKWVMKFANKIGAQIEFSMNELCLKIRRIFFTQDFKWHK